MEWAQCVEIKIVWFAFRSLNLKFYTWVYDEKPKAIFNHAMCFSTQTLICCQKVSVMSQVLSVDIACLDSNEEQNHTRVIKVKRLTHLQSNSSPRINIFLLSQICHKLWFWSIIKTNIAVTRLPCLVEQVLLDSNLFIVGEVLARPRHILIRYALFMHNLSFLYFYSRIDRRRW